MAPRKRPPRGLARQIVAVAREMSRLGLVDGTVGNVSARADGGFLITPTRTPYDRMRPRDLALLDLDGDVVRAAAPPSTERALHAAIYRARPGAGAVIHTHSLHATAWSFRGGTELPEI